MRPCPDGDRVVYATKVSLTSLGRPCLELEGETDHIDSLFAGLVEQSTSELLGIHGSASTPPPLLLVAAGDNPGRLHSEAAFARLCGVAPIEASSGDGTPKAEPPAMSIRSGVVRATAA
jgi:transposase